MQEKINRALLNLYDTAHQGGVSALNAEAFKLIKDALPGDSGAIYSAVLSPNKPTRVYSCIAMGNAREKINYRLQHVDPDRLGARGHIRSRDRLMQRAISQPHRSHTQDIYSIGDKQIYTYAKHFESFQALLYTEQKGGEHQLFSLWRASQKKLFTVEDRKIGDLLIPHIFKALEIAKKIKQLESTQDNTLVCDLSGNILINIGHSRDLINQEWPQWHHSKLPDMLLNALRPDGKSTYTRYSGRHIEIRAQQSNQLLLIECRTKNKDHSLTMAEQKVANLARLGLSYKEIGQELGSSPATIRNQLHSVYRKLEIQGKAALSNKNLFN